MNVYVIHINRNLDQQQFKRMASLVAKERCARLDKYIFFEDAQRSLLGDMLVRYAARKCYDIRNNELTFGVREYGKPFLISHPRIQYNVSHAGDYVACAIVNDIPVGIDVEIIKPIELDISKRFFTQDEYAYINRQPLELQTRCFYLIWTQKESYIKMVGKGLSISLNSFNVLNGNEAYFSQFIQNEEVIGNVCKRKKENIICESVNYEKLLEVLDI